MPNFRNVELSTNTVPGTEQLFYYFIVGDTDNLIGKHILPNRLIGEEYLRFLSDTLSELLDEVSLDTSVSCVFSTQVIQCQCQISCVVIVFVVPFLPFHFRLLYISE
jgi:hypothetical protein